MSPKSQQEKPFVPPKNIIRRQPSEKYSEAESHRKPDKGAIESSSPNKAVTMSSAVE